MPTISIVKEIKKDFSVSDFLRYDMDGNGYQDHVLDIIRKENQWLPTINECA